MAENSPPNDNDDLNETLSESKFPDTNKPEETCTVDDSTNALHVENPEVKEDLQSLPPPPPESTLSSVSFANVDSCKFFRIDVLQRCLESCIRPSDCEIDMDRYLDTFKEICKLLDNLGAVIRAYIGGDIKEKISIIKEHKAGKYGPFYETIEKMVIFEKSNGIHEADVDENGSRTILRLHRSLHFVLEFLRGLNKLNLDQGLGSMGREVYNMTLAQHHPWAYKKIGRLALSTLGAKKTLVANFHDGSMTSSQLHEVIESVVTVATRVHSQCQTIYEHHNLLELP
ncbi:unnamed protein product [Orchesella dallaii]|uniref:Glycolipid transfer protein domain-containing protein n=1 Tax=Orchesella dallaii TaxID=48710 RepID=A0ABP1RGB3_9HEXA